MKKFLSLLAGLWLVAPPTHAEVRLAALFGDHMVLQREAAVSVWGTATPDEVITVELGKQKLSTHADKDGKWRVRLAPLKPGAPLELTVTGQNKIVLRDVLVGDVWLCSGQSNMDMRVARGDRYWCGVTNEAAEVAAAKYPLIRSFYLKTKMTDEPQADVSGQWDVCSPTTVRDFSAAAYFFARDLQTNLDVPVGLIVSAFGASTAEAWVSRPALEQKSELVPLLEKYAVAQNSFSTNGAAKTKYTEAKAKWEIAAAAAKAAGQDAPKGPKNPDPGQDQHNPSVLFNGMIAPLAPCAIRGALWYQGESNTGVAKTYFTLMQTLIADWRKTFAQGDFPFIFVQLAGHKAATTNAGASSQIAALRDAQLQTLAVTNTAMATAVDVGDEKNVHPKNKQAVGARLALAARALAYGEKIPFSGPLYDSMKVESAQLRLRFKHTDGGLVARGGQLTGFALAGADRKFVWADAKIDGDSVVVSSPTVTAPVAVRYAWADNPAISLDNGAGLPASPFRTDNW
ncbi:MAG: hypothetical protein RL380_426 [Verrucomicrobiota bacterium]